MRIAFVLSGGGAKGSFQVGALRFLYTRGVAPDIICGCSVGAINGVKLAEGEGEPTQGMRGLERLWLGLRTNDDMFRREDWLNQAHPLVRDTIEHPDGGGNAGLSFAEGDYSAWGDLACLPQTIERVSVAVVGALAANEVRRNLELIATAQAVYNLDPIAWKLRGDQQRNIPKSLDTNLVQAWANTGRKLRLATVSLEAGTLRYVTEHGQLLERDNYTPVTLPTQLSSACAPIKDEIDQLVSERASWQGDLAEAVGSQKAAIAAHIRLLTAQIAERTAALRECRRLNPAPRRPAQVDLPTGVLASASIPALFRPVTMEGETYVDGGIREVLPLQAAVDLGATVIYAIDASRPDVVPAASFKGAQMFTLLGRALADLAINEVARDDQTPLRQGGRAIISIQPSFDVHEMTRIEPGLIRVAMGYGYMRASDAIDGATLEERGRQDWVEDALPSGAVPQGDEPWTWVASDPQPHSSTKAHKSAMKSGVHQHYFANAAPLQVNQHDILFAHALLDPHNPPAQVMLQWNDGTWEHRAYWGQSRIPWGTEGTASRRYLGPLPPTGRWVRLDVPATLVGLEGRAVHGMAFTLFDGQASWDVAGRRAGVVARGRDSSDRIARLRQQIRAAELAYFAAPTPGALQNLQAKKRDVRALVRQRLQLGLDVPPHIEKAWMNWEWFAPSPLPAQPWPTPPPSPPPSAIPAVCQPIATAIDDLKAERASWQELLREALPGQRASIVAQINSINATLAQREAELQACFQQHAPPQPLDPVRHGLLLQGSGPERYVVYGGSRLWIRDVAAFNGMGYQTQDVLQVPDEVLARFPQDRPVDGTLLRAKGGAPVYVMDGGKRRRVTSPAVLQREAPVWDNASPHVRDIPGGTLTAIPEGPDVL